MVLCSNITAVRNIRQTVILQQLSARSAIPGDPAADFANRSDIAGGSTLGNISTAHVSIPSADVGLAQLAMHSAFETAGVKDTEALAQLAEHLFV